MSSAFLQNSIAASGSLPTRRGMAILPTRLNLVGRPAGCRPLL